MTPPEVTEKKLEKLLKCLVQEFIKEFGEQKHRLSEKKFYLTDRYGCCKSADLNYQYNAIDRRNGDELIRVFASKYAEAVNILQKRGYVFFDEKNPLIFSLTELGYTTAQRLKHKNIGQLKKLMVSLNNNQGLIAFIGLILTIVTYLSSKD